mgnify:CR=1 FL=1
MTLREYVEEQRFQRAVNLLFSRDMTLSEIAYECGFNDGNYFSYKFKEAYGVSPTKIKGKKFDQPLQKRLGIGNRKKEQQA